MAGLDRRQLLLSSAAWIGGIAAVAQPRPAGAFEIRELSRTSPLGLAYTNHCGPANSEHAAIAAQLRAKLATDPSHQTLTATCPICGCPIIVSR